MFSKDSIRAYDYMGYALLLAAMVGIIQLGLGLLRAGFLINFFPKR